MRIPGALFAAVAAGLLVAGSAFGQAYPAKPVRLIIGNPPGGPSDLLLRGIGESLSQAWRQPFVVENRTGADGMIAGEACARSAPDGHTLCMADAFNVALNPVIRANMPYDPLKDLAPVVHVGFLPSSVWVNVALPASSVAELFALAKARPGSINWATFGTASSSHIYVEWLRNVRGLYFVNIPYKNAQSAWQAVVSGEAQVASYATRAGMPQQKAGKVKMLTVSTDARSPELPQVPTMKEAGFDFSFTTWFGLFGPSGMPRDIVQRVNAEMGGSFFGNPAAKARYLDGQGLVIAHPTGASPEVFGAFVKSESEMYAKAIREAKIKPE